MEIRYGSFFMENREIFNEMCIRDRREGGPEHCRGHLEAYLDRLAGTPREYGIPLLKEKYSYWSRGEQ